MAAVQLAVVPVLIHFPSQDDDVTLVELEVARLFALVAVECLAAGELRDILQKTKQTTIHQQPMKKQRRGIYGKNIYSHIRRNR